MRSLAFLTASAEKNSPLSLTFAWAGLAIAIQPSSRAAISGRVVSVCIRLDLSLIRRAADESPRCFDRGLSSAARLLRFAGAPRGFPLYHYPLRGRERKPPRRGRIGVLSLA